jgi:hypothetical protein
MSKKDTLITGKITNLESGKKWNIQFKPFFTDLIMMAIIKVEKTEIQSDTDNLESAQITVKGMALDSLGLVYRLNLVFLPETVAKRNKILTAMKKNTISLVKGRYSICQKDLIVIINEPKYIPLPKSLNEKEVREAFKVNSNPLMKL